MIDDLDRTLEELLRHELPAVLVEHVAISFAAPDSEFPPAAVPLPAINLFLYDVRENRELRNPEWLLERHENGTATRLRAPVRVACSYLVTAWPSDAAPNPSQDEHRLLGEVMKVLLRHPVIPEVLLQGSLQGQEPPLPAITIQPSELQSWGDFWQAIGSKPKAALNYKVTIGVPVDLPAETEVPVIEKKLRFVPSVEEQ
jgi:hypothetical protein